MLYSALHCTPASCPRVPPHEFWFVVEKHSTKSLRYPILSLYNLADELSRGSCIGEEMEKLLDAEMGQPGPQPCHALSHASARTRQRHVSPPGRARSLHVRCFQGGLSYTSHCILGAASVGMVLERASGQFRVQAFLSDCILFALIGLYAYNNFHSQQLP